MKRCVTPALAVLLMTTGLVISAPSASAGCVYGGPVISTCDGPIQPDGGWQRCDAVAQVIPRGASSYLAPVKNCYVVGPQNPADPPTHID